MDESLANVVVNSKREKTTKKGKPYWILETNKGSMMVFEAGTAASITEQPGIAYELLVSPYDQQFKSRTVKKVIGTMAAPVEHVEERHVPSDDTHIDAKDVRITKLSLLSTAANIVAQTTNGKQDDMTAMAAVLRCFEIMATKVFGGDSFGAELVKSLGATPPSNPAPQAQYVMPQQTPVTPAPAPTMQPTHMQQGMNQAQGLFKVDPNIEQKMAQRLKEMSGQ